MSQLSKDDVRKLARLARLRLSETEVDTYKEEFDRILDYVGQLSEVDTEGLKPTYSVHGNTTVVRPDEVVSGGVDGKTLLREAPKTRENYIEVKRMLG